MYALSTYLCVIGPRTSNYLINMAFRERLEVIVKESSLRTIARETGISESAIRKWLKGDTEPALGNLVALAQMGGVNVEWLATGDGPMRKGERSHVESPSLQEKLDRLDRRSHTGKPGIDLSKPEIHDMMGRLAERYGLSEQKLALVIDNLCSVGVGDDFVMVPRYDVSASAGPGAVSEGERVMDRIAFRLDWLQRELRLPVGGLVVVRARGDSMEPTIDEGDILLVDSCQERLTDGGIFVILRGDELVVKRIQNTADGFLLVSDNGRYQPEKIPATEDEGPRVIGRVVWVGHRL